jgi:ketosteroid isomerase-like protein
MPRENVELVGSICADWERGDFSAAEWADAEIEYEMADGPQPGRWTGIRGMAEGTAELLGAWDGYRVVADEYRELDDERVLVILHAGGRGKTSGLRLEETAGKGANVFHVRDGRVIKLVAYFDLDRALADLELASEGERD